MNNVFKKLRPGARSLKTQLAIYFIPVALLPAVGVSLYASRAFERSNQENLVHRAQNDKESIVAEIENRERDLLSQLKIHAKAKPLIAGFEQKNATQAKAFLNALKPGIRARLFDVEGQFWIKRSKDITDPQIPYISKEGLRRVKAFSETMDRYISSEDQGIVTIARSLIKSNERVYGILEEEMTIGPRELEEIKRKRGCDLVLLSRNFLSMAGSFSVSKEELEKITLGVFRIPEDGAWNGSKSPIFARIGEGRFAAFLYDMPSGFGKIKHW